MELSEIQEIYSKMNQDESENYFCLPAARQSHKQLAGLQRDWNTLTLAALETASLVDPFQSDLPLGSLVPAVEAQQWPVNGHRGCDIRPRLLDKATGQSRLIDSGSMITATARGPNDKIDESIKLVAVNGSEIKTYGVKEIEIKIGRKAYKMEAVICDIKSDILGMDFLNKYKLNLEWDEVDQSELYIVDKKADIRKELQIITVPSDTPRMHYLGQGSDQSPPLSARKGVSPEVAAFEMACMKKLDENVETKVPKVDWVKLHGEEFVSLIKKYPKLLTPTFAKGEPAHGVYH